VHYYYTCFFSTVKNPTEQAVLKITGIGSSLVQRNTHACAHTHVYTHVHTHTHTRAHTHTPHTAVAYIKAVDSCKAVCSHGNINNLYHYKYTIYTTLYTLLYIIHEIHDTNSSTNNSNDTNTNSTSRCSILIYIKFNLQFWVYFKTSTSNLFWCSECEYMYVCITIGLNLKQY